LKFYAIDLFSYFANEYSLLIPKFDY